MTVFANVAGLNMSWPFTGRIGTVVTAHAVARDIYVIKIRGQPACGRVAIVAIVATGDVILVLTGRRITVVAGSASTDYLRMIDRVGGIPDIRRMAILTHVAGLDV